jgi:hypothetical protein
VTKIQYQYQDFAGFAHFLRLASLSSTNPALNEISGPLGTWAVFLTFGITFPFLVLLIFVPSEQNTMLTVVERALLPLIAGWVPYIWHHYCVIILCHFSILLSYSIHRKAKKATFHLSQEEITEAKFLITLILIVVVEAFEFLVLEEILLAIKENLELNELNLNIS